VRSLQPFVISSLTPDAIRKGFAALRPGATTIPWQMPRAAAVGRLACGMNMSRAYSLATEKTCRSARADTDVGDAGGAQLAIRSFVPETT